MTYFTTVTSKGQITLPVEFRRAMKVSAGQKLAIKYVDNSMVVAPVADADDVRSRTKKHLESQGFTPDKLKEMAKNYRNGDGYEAHVKEKYGQPGH
jgi:bifunctional DNA-binding transcriptional regulator/antitoxin component of YhaV-PrlF toxin-antitoxin module